MGHDVRALENSDDPESVATKAAELVRSRTKQWFSLYHRARKEGRAPPESNPHHAVPAWNQAMVFALRAGQVGLARALYNDLRNYNIKPTSYTLAGYLGGLAAHIRRAGADSVPLRIKDHVQIMGDELEAMIEQQTGDDVAAKIDPILISAQTSYLAVLTLVGRVHDARNIFETLCPDPRTNPKLPSPYATAAFYTSFLNALCMIEFEDKSDYLFDFWDRWETGVRRNMPQVPKFDQTCTKTLIWSMALDEDHARGAASLTHYLSQYIGVHYKRAPRIAKMLLENPIPIAPRSVTDALKLYIDRRMFAHAADVADHLGTDEPYAIKLALIAYAHLGDYERAAAYTSKDLSLSNYAYAINACTTAVKKHRSDGAFDVGIAIAKRCAETHGKIPIVPLTSLAITNLERHNINDIMDKLAPLEDIPGIKSVMAELKPYIVESK
ncbi:hypothetical protein MCUN1_000090 [Malassezia cuniculi]|uniref:Uncharacterized protein n=1 Tax=Malassezia cuniculi TaxID=948313 RepID=A0AAF0EUN2_9BASI|nr:hypothetical protein MCUN1_000090 [Malassezia cuniculi]